MPNQKEKNILLEIDNCSSCPQESGIDQSPILLQTEIPVTSSCSCCKSSEEQPTCSCCEPLEASEKNN